MCSCNSSSSPLKSHSAASLGERKPRLIHAHKSVFPFASSPNFWKAKASAAILVATGQEMDGSKTPGPMSYADTWPMAKPCQTIGPEKSSDQSMLQHSMYWRLYKGVALWFPRTGYFQNCTFRRTVDVSIDSCADTWEVGIGLENHYVCSTKTIWYCWLAIFYV